MAGRPLIKEKLDIKNYNRTEDICVKPKDLNNNQFNKEKDLSDFITYNIEYFCNDILEDELISFEVDKTIVKQRRFGARGRRVDLYIICKNKHYIIELKNPTSLSENTAGIGQILDYGRQFPYPKKELILITTMFDKDTHLTIKHYNLPIRYLYFEKGRVLELLKELND
jgi:hypothetical protein